jgi:hypothetical protein
MTMTSQLIKGNEQIALQNTKKNLLIFFPNKEILFRAHCPLLSEVALLYKKPSEKKKIKYTDKHGQQMFFMRSDERNMGQQLGQLGN